MIRPATAHDVIHLARTMREEDAAEIAASGGYSPMDALVEAVRISDFTHALYVDDELLALWGVVPVGGTVLGGADAGVVWALTSTAVVRHRREFWATSKAVVEALAARYPVLCNMVDARYTAAVRWAERLGFVVSRPVPFGVRGELFHPITLTGAKHV